MITMVKKSSVLITGSAAVLVTTAAIMMIMGSASIQISAILSVLVAKLTPFETGLRVPVVIEKIIWDIRWPRVATAMLVGSSLAVSGACYQAMFRNPLADPFILGVSSGAALGAAVSIVLNMTAYINLFAFLGGLAAIVVVYGLGRAKEGSISANQLLLAGVAFGSLLNALLSSLMVFHTQQIGAILFWLLGSLNNPSANLGVVAAMVVTGMCVILLYARDMDVMTAGDDNARYLGVDVGRVKVILLFCTTLITSAVVSISGVIGFIGLIVPHILRKLVGPQHRLLLPLSALWGAIFLLWADGVTRSMDILSQVPVGVITALFGSPFFLYILYSGRRSGKGGVG